MGRYMVCQLIINPSNVTWVDMDQVLIGQWIFNYSLRHLASPYIIVHHLTLPYIIFGTKLEVKNNIFSIWWGLAET